MRYVSGSLTSRLSRICIGDEDTKDILCLIFLWFDDLTTGTRGKSVQQRLVIS